MKIIKFPELRQTFDFDCGAKATQAVLAYYKIDIQESKIIKSAGTDKRGTPISGIIKTVKKYGLKCDAKSMTLDEIKKYINKNVPVIVVLQAWTSKKKKFDWEKDWNDGHYVVAIGYDKNNLYFEDPSSVLRTYLSFDEFEERWHDVDNRNGKKYYNYGIVVYGKESGYDLNNVIHMD